MIARSIAALVVSAVVAPTALAAAPIVVTGRAAADRLPPKPPVTRRAGYAEPLTTLGAGSPTCASALGPTARRNCERTGSVAHAYPISSYGFDVQIGFSITNLGDSFLGALQSIAALLWMALVYLVKGVLLLVEWGFSLDILGAAMNQVRHSLDTLHREVIGEPWFLAAISVTALWGMWRGLVQRKASETLVGLAATVALMVAGLVVMSDPVGTVGHASRLVNDASLGVLSAATSGHVAEPSDALSAAMAGVFDRTVRDPWCALEFGSVDYCEERAHGSRELTNADVWLAYPAQSKERKALYKLLKGEHLHTGGGLLDVVAGPLETKALDLVGLRGDDADLSDAVRDRVQKEPGRVVMQEAGGTFPRFALLALIGLGMTGAICLLAYIGVRLLLASMLALLLLLFTPAVLLAPAFGESGRATFVAWGRRLMGALAAKLIYAFFLALVLTASSTLARIDIGWFGGWLVQIAFWWGVLLKRKDPLGYASAGASNTLAGEQRGSAIGQAFYAAQLGVMGSRVARGASAPLGSPLASARRAIGERREARHSAVAGLATEALDRNAERALLANEASAARTLDNKRGIERELRVVDRRLMGYDEAHAAARAARTSPPTPDAEQATLLQRRTKLLAALSDPQVHAAEQIARHAAINRAQTGGPVSPRDLVAHRESRRRDLATDVPLDHERNLSAAGIDPTEYFAATDAEREVLRQTVELHLNEERRMLATADGDGAVRFDPALVRRRSAQERARLRAERRARQVRAVGGRR